MTRAPASPIGTTESGASQTGENAAASRTLERRLIDSVVGKTEITHLPALPVLIDRALKSSRGRADAADQVHWISLDPILTLRLLDATVDAERTQLDPDFRSLAQRLSSLQPEMVHALLVSAAQASLAPGRPGLSSEEQARFWFHGLHCAFLCRAFASAISYRNLEEAYVAGLLHDIGTLALVTAVPKTFRSLVAEQGVRNGIPEHAGRLGTVHAKIGAALTEALGMPFYFTDSVLLHHAPKADLYGTHPLVRIVRAAEALAQPSAPPDQQTSVAELLDISPLLVAHLEEQATKQVNAVLRDLGLRSPPAPSTKPTEETSSSSVLAMARLTDTLVGRLVEETERSAASAGASSEDSSGPASATTPAEPVASAADAWVGNGGAARSILGQIAGDATLSKAANLLQAAPSLRDAILDVRLLAAAVAGLKRAVLFVTSGSATGWPGWLIDAGGLERIRLDLATAAPRSVVARAAREGVASTSIENAQGARLAGMDMQIARLLGSEHIAALPLRASGNGCVGVLVFGTSRVKARRLAENLPFLTGLADAVSQSLAVSVPAAPSASRAEAADEVRSRTRQLVHEARNPLSVLKTYLQIARDRAAEGESLERELAIASQEVERVAELLNQIGKPFRTDGPAYGGAEVTTSPKSNDERSPPAAAANPRFVERVMDFLEQHGEAPAPASNASVSTDINRTVREMLQVYGSALFASKGISVSRMLEARVPPVRCDESGLKQVLLNLFKNASEAMGNDGQLVVATTAGVNYQGQTMVEISVTDNGPGIPLAVLERLFAGPGPADANADRGFGLPNSLAIVQAMHGHLLCRSEPGTGTTFSILLPRGPESRPENSNTH